MLREIPVATSAATTPDLVQCAMLRCAQEYGEALVLPHTSHLEQAHRAECLGVVCERRARWWGALLRWTFSPACTLPWVFGAAVLDARHREQSNARFWREVAADAHAEHAARVIAEHVDRVSGRAS